MKKRRPNKAEAEYIATAKTHCCMACGSTVDIEFHHLPGARTENALIIGYPLCKKCHTGQEFPGQSVHNSRLLFESRVDTELRLLQKFILKMMSRTIPF